jgi:release factor glutamine methyltransferase
MTSAEAVGRARDELERAGFSVDTALRDATLLARAVLGWSMADWLLRSSEPASTEFQTRLSAFISRRTAHEPIAYILGTREFYGRDFRVTPAVLIPRPETELIVDEALRVLKPLITTSAASGAARRATTVVDVGTGSGCLAVTLALELGSAAIEVIATDASDSALGIARENAKRLGAAEIDFRCGDLLAGYDGPVDAIVSNPPYVATADRGSLPREVVDYEPAGALFGADDGLQVIRRLIAVAAVRLAPRIGVLVLEIGQGQLPAVSDSIARHGMVVAGVRDDLQDIPRVVVARA